MKRLSLAGSAAGLMLVLAACSGLRGGATVSPPPRMKVPVVLAALTSGSADSPAEGFQVAEVGPSGTIPHENLEGGVWVLFNKPVIALKTLDKPATSSAILTITPRIEGIYRWYGSRLLAFEPKGPLAPATEYSFSVNGSLRSLQGESLTGDTKFTFRTEPLSIVSVTPSGDDVIPEASRQVVVTFNFPVDMKTILPFIRLQSGGRPVAFKAARPVITDRAQLGPYENTDRLVVLTPAKELPWDTDISVRVMKGAKPRPENYGSDAEITEGFHTLRPLTIEETNVSMGRDGAIAEIRFNHSIKDDTAAPNLKLDDPNYVVEKNIEVSGSWVLLHSVPADFDSSFAVDVLSDIADIYGQKLGTSTTESFDVGPAASYVQFRDSGQKILESQFPPKVAVEMQNVDSGSYAVGTDRQPVRQAAARRSVGHRHGKDPAQRAPFRALRPPAVPQRRGQGRRVPVVDLQRPVRRKRHPRRGKGEPRRPGHRHRCVPECRLQFASRHGQLPGHRRSRRQRGGEPPQGREDSRLGEDRRERPCNSHLLPGSARRRLQGKRGTGGNRDRRGEGPPGPAAVGDAGPHVECQRAVFRRGSEAADLHLVRPRHLPAGRNAVLCGHRPGPRPGHVRTRTGTVPRGPGQRF